MFVLRGSGLIAVFSVLVTSVLAQDRSSEESEAKITGQPHPSVPASFFFLS